MRQTKIVVATRKSADDFFKHSATGKSILRFQHYDADLQLFPNNTVGLPEIYNKIIEESLNTKTNIIFMHDDIHILDTNWIEKTNDALQNFPIIGIAGNKYRHPRQPSWFFRNENFEKDNADNLSGIVAHGKDLNSMSVSYYGPPRQQVKIIDGLYIGITSEAASENGLRFDTRFAFHFYDLDLCRSAQALGIKIGTWDISLMHESGGAFNSEDWTKAKNTYFQKWSD